MSKTQKQTIATQFFACSQCIASAEIPYSKRVCWLWFVYVCFLKKKIKGFPLRGM